MYYQRFVDLKIALVHVRNFLSPPPHYHMAQQLRQGGDVDPTAKEDYEPSAVEFTKLFQRLKLTCSSFLHTLKWYFPTFEL